MCRGWSTRCPVIAAERARPTPCAAPAHGGEVCAPTNKFWFVLTASRTPPGWTISIDAQSAVRRRCSAAWVRRPAGNVRPAGSRRRRSAWPGQQRRGRRARRRLPAVQGLTHPGRPSRHRWEAPPRPARDKGTTSLPARWPPPSTAFSDVLSFRPAAAPLGYRTGSAGERRRASVARSAGEELRSAGEALRTAGERDPGRPACSTAPDCARHGRDGYA